ncbi:hypothetical protein Fmac_001709 [Flemingia macrophylla]|uniref:Uncharacterized protein n=1 Tax=Flemingia macrophylla TaxID=520843 RepID=A0ABD1NHV2_9FABA
MKVMTFQYLFEQQICDRLAIGSNAIRINIQGAQRRRADIQGWKRAKRYAAAMHQEREVEGKFHHIYITHKREKKDNQRLVREEGAHGGGRGRKKGGGERSEARWKARVEGLEVRVTRMEGDRGGESSESRGWEREERGVTRLGNVWRDEAVGGGGAGGGALRPEGSGWVGEIYKEASFPPVIITQTRNNISEASVAKPCHKSSSRNNGSETSVAKNFDKLSSSTVCKYIGQMEIVYGQQCRNFHSWFRRDHCLSSAAKLQEHKEVLDFVNLGSDKLFSGSTDGTVRAWDCHTGGYCAWNIQTSSEFTLDGPKGQVLTMIVGNDTLFAGGEDGVISGWRGSSEASSSSPSELVAPLTGNSRAVVSLTVGLLNRLFLEKGHLFAKKEVSKLELGHEGLFFTRDETGLLTVWKWMDELKVASTVRPLSVSLMLLSYLLLMGEDNVRWLQRKEMKMTMKMKMKMKGGDNVSVDEDEQKNGNENIEDDEDEQDNDDDYDNGK